MASGDGSPALRPVLLLAGFAALVFLAEALRPAVGSDLRYVEASWEMQAGHDWLIPHLAYVPYFEKPILLYWLGAAAQWLFGESGPATQLPSVVCSVASLVVTWAWATSLRGERFALAAAALLLASGLFLAMGSILTTDPLLALCVTGAFYAAWRHEQGAGRSWIWWFWLAAALGALAKGPLAWVLIGCGIAPYLVLSRRLREVPRAIWAMRPLSGLAVLFAVNVPWWWAVWRVDPRFVEFFFVSINLRGLTSATVNHPGPPWYYVGVLAMALAPFTLLAGWPLSIRLWQVGRETWQALGARRRGEAAVMDAAHRGDLYLWCTALMPTLFLSISASKLQTYLLPLMPSFVMLTAEGLGLFTAAPPRWMRRVVALEIGLLAVASIGLVVVVAQHRLPVALPALALLAGGVALVALLVGHLLAYAALRREQLVRALAMLGVGTILAAIAIGPVIYAWRLRSNATLLARYVKAHAGVDDEVVICTALAENYEIVNTLHRRCAYAGPVRELGMGHATEATAPTTPLPDRPYEVSGATLPGTRWLLSEEDLFADWQGAQRVWLFADDGIAARLREQGLPVFAIMTARKARLLSNLPAVEATAPTGAPAPPAAAAP